MSVVQTLIGNVKGPQGATGATGATGPQGDAATINVGSVSTTAYGNPAQVVNVGTENEAILNFVIPQGKPGQATTTMGGLTLDTITTSTADFPSPQVGDTGATAFGKIVKFFADALSALNSKLNAANVVNNLTTTEAGYALDARAGKTLNDSLGGFKCLVAEQVSISTTAQSWTLPASSVCMVLLVSGDNSVVSGLWFFRVGTSSLQMLQISKGSETTISTNGLSFAITKTTSSRTSTIVIYRLADII